MTVYCIQTIRVELNSESSKVYNAEDTDSERNRVSHAGADLPPFYKI